MHGRRVPTVLSCCARPLAGVPLAHPYLTRIFGCSLSGPNECADRGAPAHRSLEAYGPAHTDTLNAVNNLAVFLKSIGRFDKALPLYERVLAGDEAALGPDHPHTVRAISLQPHKPTAISLQQ